MMGRVAVLEYMLLGMRGLLQLCPTSSGNEFASIPRGRGAGCAYLIMEAPGWGG
jgi:hypothetical protein